MSALRRAVFLDRDGTLIRDVAYLATPDAVELLPGAQAAVRALNDAAVVVIVVSNQSGIGRGYFTRAAYERTQARVEDALAGRRTGDGEEGRTGGVREGGRGARLDGVYVCPHAPASAGKTGCGCRKPGTLLFERAAVEHGLDLARSWAVGDRWRDLEPVLRLGGRGILVPQPGTPAGEIALARTHAAVAATLLDAVGCILARSPSEHPWRGASGPSEGLTEHDAGR